MHTRGAAAKKPIGTRFRKQIALQIMVLMGVFHVLVFSYIPMGGILIAFKDYSVISGIIASPWVGFKHFIEMFSDPMFYSSYGNSIVLALIGLVVGFPIPILLALIINEIPLVKYKKAVQTASYLPHFVPMVIVASMWVLFLDTKGLVNNLLLMLGVVDRPLEFFAEAKYYRTVVTALGIWKGMGWSAIVYLANISGINPEIYESAVIDGAGRIRRIVSITLPNMVGLLSVMLILSVPGLVGSGSLDNSVLFGNAFNREVSYVLSHYTLQMGLEIGRYSYATAIGLFTSILSLVLVLAANWGSGKTTGRRIF